MASLDRVVNVLARRTLGKFRQPENAALTYTCNYAGLTDSAISTSAWSAEDSGLTIANAATGTNSATARLSGQSGRTYRAVNKVVFANGDTAEGLVDLTVTDNTGAYYRASDYDD